MADESDREPQGWLEVVGTGDEPHLVHCPCKGRDMPLAHCLACERYASLAIDPSGKHVYLDCCANGQGETAGEGVKDEAGA